MMFDENEPISDESRALIEQETRKLLDDAFVKAMNILKTYEKEHHRLAAVRRGVGERLESLTIHSPQALLERETLTADEMRMLIKGKQLPPLTPEQQ